MSTAPWWPRRAGRDRGGLLPLVLPMVLPMLLAVLARLGGGRAPAAARPASLAWLLFLGPVLETLLLMCAATLMLRHLPGPRPAPGTVIALITVSFVLAHGLQLGAAALASLPMAWVLSEAATRTAALPDAASQLCGAARLTALHVVYNGCLCLLA